MNEWLLGLQDEVGYDGVQGTPLETFQTLNKNEDDYIQIVLEIEAGRSEQIERWIEEGGNESPFFADAADRRAVEFLASNFFEAGWVRSPRADWESLWIGDCFWGSASRSLPRRRLGVVSRVECHLD